jgi:hypothetical protein
VVTAIITLRVPMAATIIETVDIPSSLNLLRTDTTSSRNLRPTVEVDILNSKEVGDLSRPHHRVDTLAVVLPVKAYLAVFSERTVAVATMQATEATPSNSL